jgi:PAS domain-containing protein
MKNVPSLKSFHHTEGNPMKDKLRHEEHLFRTFVEHSADIIVLLNLEGIITYINSAVEKILGFKPEERKRQDLY